MDIDEYMTDMLAIADRVLSDVKAEEEEERNKDYGSFAPVHVGEYAIVEKENGIVHLVASCNAQEDYYTIESYGSNGWYVRASDLTDGNFWSVWSTWNGHVCGSIYLDDYEYPQDGTTPMWDDYVGKYKEVSVGELASIPDGTYTVYA